MRLNNGLIGRALRGKASAGRYRDGRNGLILVVGNGGAASWVMRYMHEGRRHDLGLGPLKHVGLAQARNLAASKMGSLKGDRIDPLADRVEARQHQKLSSMTFGMAAARFIEAKKAGWKDRRAVATWTNSLNTHARSLTAKRVGEITTSDVYSVLAAIWSTHTSTAVAVRGRIEAVLAWAKVQGHRDGSNPAAWKDNLAAMLPKPKAVKRGVKHHEAVPFAALPAVYGWLVAMDHPIAAFVRFTLLTAARAGEVKGARRSEIDFAAGTWTVPSERMKKDRMHVVPLGAAALELVQSLPKDDDLLFPQRFYPSDYLRVLREAAAQFPTATLHGTARSGFDDWATSNGYPDRLIDYSLAHYPQGMTQAAYRRDGLVEQRRPIMEAWQNFLVSKVDANLALAA